MIVDESYHLDYANVSKSMLKQLADDAFVYHEMFVRTPPTMFPKPPNATMDFGTAAHRILLHGKTIDDVVKQYPRSCLNTNDGLIGEKALVYRAEHADKVCMKPDDVIRLMDVLEAVYLSDLGPLIERASEREKPMYWRDAGTGIACRSMPDFWIDLDETTAVYDLKFSEDISDSGFDRSQSSQSWYLQDAHYSSGMIHKFLKPSAFRFWSIETEYPYRVFPRWLDVRSREIAMSRYAKLMNELADRRAENNWEADWSHYYTVRARWDD